METESGTPPIDTLLYGWIENRSTPSPQKRDMEPDRKAVRLAHAVLVGAANAGVLSLHRLVAEQLHLPRISRAQRMHIPVYTSVPDVPLDRKALAKHDEDEDGLFSVAGLVATAHTLRNQPTTMPLVGRLPIVEAVTDAVYDHNKIMRTARRHTGERLQHDDRVPALLWQEAVRRVASDRKNYKLPQTAIGVAHAFYANWENTGRSGIMRDSTQFIAEIRSCTTEAVLGRAQQALGGRADIEPVAAHTYVAQLCLNGLGTAMNKYLPQLRR